MLQQKELALPALVIHPEDAQQRRFSSTRRPHDGDKFPLFDLQSDLAQDVAEPCPRLEALLDVSQLDHGLVRVTRSGAPRSVRCWLRAAPATRRPARPP